jgi:transposase
MPQLNDLSRSLAALDQDSTLIAVIEMSQTSWLIGAIVPGVEGHPLKKLVPDEDELLRSLQRWRDEAMRAGRTITRNAVTKRAGTASGWPAGCRPAASKIMSSMPRAWRSHASTAGRRPIGWMSSR